VEFVHIIPLDMRGSNTIRNLQLDLFDRDLGAVAVGLDDARSARIMSMAA
jgi:hypothetical protein